MLQQCGGDTIEGMGRIEEKVAADVRRTRINRAVLGAISVAGILSVAAVAPGALRALKIFSSALSQKKKQSIERSFARLVDRGYIGFEHQTGRVRLTPKGERLAALFGEGTLAPKKPKRWDGKWRLLVFDIPEHRRGTRTRLRATLTRIGFKHLQDSVWVYPYPCEDFLVLLKADFRIGKDLLYVVADQLEYDAPLRSHFGLPKT